jgi:hypothetical protein
LVMCNTMHCTLLFPTFPRQSENPKTN